MPEPERPMTRNERLAEALFETHRHAATGAISVEFHSDVEVGDSPRILGALDPWRWRHEVEDALTNRGVDRMRFEWTPAGVVVELAGPWAGAPVRATADNKFDAFLDAAMKAVLLLKQENRL